MSSIPPGIRPTRAIPTFGKTTAGTVFVGNLSFFCEESHLRSLFSSFGLLNDIEVVRSRNGNSLLYGFVDFANPSDGEVAIRQVHGSLFMGRRIRLFWAKDESSSRESQPREGRTVHVSFVVHDLDTTITEETLYALFSTHGEIEDITIRRYYRHSKRHMQYGYAFVDYLRPEHASSAVTVLHNSVHDGVKYDCSMSKRSSAGGSGSSDRASKTRSPTGPGTVLAPMHSRNIPLQHHSVNTNPGVQRVPYPSEIGYSSMRMGAPYTVANFPSPVTDGGNIFRHNFGYETSTPTTSTASAENRPPFVIYYPVNAAGTFLPAANQHSNLSHAPYPPLLLPPPHVDSYRNPSLPHQTPSYSPNGHFPGVPSMPNLSIHHPSPSSYNPAMNPVHYQSTGSHPPPPHPPSGNIPINQQIFVSPPQHFSMGNAPQGSFPPSNTQSHSSQHSAHSPHAYPPSSYS